MGAVAKVSAGAGRAPGNRPVAPSVRGFSRRDDAGHDEHLGNEVAALGRRAGEERPPCSRVRGNPRDLPDDPLLVAQQAAA